MASENNSPVLPSADAWARVVEAVKAFETTTTDVTGTRHTLPTLRNVVVKVDGAVSGQQGRYTGKVLVTQKPDSTGDLAAGDLGTATGDAIIWYPPDIGGSTPGLDYTGNNGYRVGFLVGWQKTKAVVVIGASGSSSSGTPASFDVVTSVTWNLGGNGKLQYQTQVITIPGGSISSAITTHDIDTPADCT